MNIDFFLFPVLSGVVSFLVAAVLRGPLCDLMSESQFVAVNYRGESIPKGMGVVIPLASVVSIGVLAWVMPSYSMVSLWMVLLFGLAFLGLFDDAAGDRRHGGFGQHLRALVTGKATTGALKALYGGALCLYAGWLLSETWTGTLTTALLLALATNTINLLDVRPGRALKGYAIMILAGVVGLLILPSSLSQPWAHITAGAATVGAAGALWPGDVRAEYMLGDAGSNVLGIAGGLLLAGGPLWWQLIWLALFVFLHLVAERSSLTQLIESVDVLNRIDRWGRS